VTEITRSIVTTYVRGRRRKAALPSAGAFGEIGRGDPIELGLEFSDPSEQSGHLFREVIDLVGQRGDDVPGGILPGGSTLPGLAASSTRADCSGGFSRIPTTFCGHPLHSREIGRDSIP